jgi:hypothetical protein
MLLILELVFFGMGLYGLITAKLPSWFVGKGFFAEGNEVRLLSIPMIAPLPLALCAGLVLGIIDPDLIWVGSAIEFVAVIAAAIIVIVVLRKIRKPVETKVINQQFNQE